MSGYVHPKAGWKVTLDGKDLTSIIDPLLITLTIAEKRGDAADQLDIVISDAGGKLEIPKEGARLRVSLGWERGSGLPQGLIDKGEFKVDEATFSGPPDIITIRARSADFTDAFRVRRERSFVGKTVSEVVGAIAAANGLTAKVEDALGSKTIPALGHGAKSDAALLQALGKRFDAVATVKAGALIFAPIGSGKTSSGKALPTVEIARNETVSIDYQRVTRGQYDGVEANWHDKAGAARHKVQHGHSGKGKAKRLRKLYASEADARQAAEAESARITRRVATARLKLAYGRPDLFPEIPVTLDGFKTEIDARKWLIEGATHRMDGSGGLTSDLELEAQQ
ncbi:phage protein D [Sphingobium sp. B1D7B]|uniref:contractile injection system protein, VgrG/Pvc8 family n=1 Tax=Sphingobium sp. B1D7B TaxID=2940578 RepID=UPI002224B414|nr:contractile injection system protein, VgrG/Pvc8 family [Sphingobium sp. B1D7B]MCW2405279.1 phage protein D [Sphingobium sp. B1D7B]